MSEGVVDSIIASLEVRLGNYVANFNKAADAHERFTRTRPDKTGQFTTAEIQRYSDRHKQSGDVVVQASEKASRAVKKRSADEVAADRASASASKQAAKERIQAAKDVANAEKAAAREISAARRVIREPNVAPARGAGRIGATVPREGTGQRGIPANLLAGTASAEVAEVAAVNHLLADQSTLQSRIAVANGATKRALQDQVAEMRLENQLRRAGLADEEILLRIEQRRAFVAAERASAERKRAESGVANFARGAGVGRFSGAGTAAGAAGLAVAVGTAVGVEVIQSAVEYGKAIENLSKQLGITVEDLQAYQKLARESGVETATLSSAFGQFASNLGRAQQGQEEYAKVFKALGVNIKDFSSAGDALPTIIDRISSLKDPLQRAAIETRLFGEEGRKLDPLLSGGAARVSDLAVSLQETGRALSQKEIRELDETARKLADVKNALQVDFARIVAGNAQAIVNLANSFGILADRIVQTISRLQEFGARQILYGLPSKFASDDDKAAARTALKGTQTGRQTLFTDNTNKINANIARYRLAPNDENLLAAQAPGSPRKTVAQVKREQLAAANAGLLKERQDILAANRAGDFRITAPVQLGSVNQGLLKTLGAPKGPKGKSAEALAREEEQRTRQFNDQLAQAQDEYLRAEQQMTGNVVRRAEIEAQMVETASAARLADIESQRKRNVLAGADAKLEAARAAELVAAEIKAKAANLAAIEQDKQLDLARSLTAANASVLDAQAGTLSAALVMARSTAERRDIELRLLANTKAQERNRLEGVVNSSRFGSQEQGQALSDLITQDDRYKAQEASTRYQNRSGGEQYRDSLPRTADQINDALDEVKVRGLQSLDDKITDSISKVFKLGGAFGEVANGIISDLIRIGVQRAIIGPLADSLFGAATGGGGAITGLLGKIGLSGARASGGPVVGGANYLVGERGPEIVNFPASGRVYPNGTLPTLSASVAGGNTYHISVDATNSVAPEGFAAGLARSILQEADRMDRARQTASINSVPGYLSKRQPLKG